MYTAGGPLYMAATKGKYNIFKFYGVLPSQMACKNAHAPYLQDWTQASCTWSISKSDATGKDALLCSHSVSLGW